MSDTNACLYCGNPATEHHHIAGESNDPMLTVDLCTPCHQETHRDMRAMGVQLDRQQRSMLERLVAFLRALGVHFLALGERLMDWADLVASIIASPARQWPETA